MNNKLYTLNEAIEKIITEKPLIIAGDENLLAQLPKGNWIAGTIPYFMSEKGGEISNEKVFINEIPHYTDLHSVKVYDENTIQQVYTDAPANGFSFIIIPAMGKVHLSFALNAPNFENFACSPLIGWISGVHLNDLGKAAPAAINGQTKESLKDKAVVMHFNLPANKVAEISTINIFTQGNGDTISFISDGFSAKEAIINGKTVNFAQYVTEKKLDTRLPLVANYSGAMVNISFQSVDEQNRQVNFYAPVFKGIEYKQAKAVSNYIADFTSQMPKSGVDNIVFSCNCILNFLYSELEGKTTGGITGPITFGEIAYQLLNQTLVYISIHEV